MAARAVYDSFGVVSRVLEVDVEQKRISLSMKKESVTLMVQSD